MLDGGRFKKQPILKLGRVKEEQKIASSSWRREDKMEDEAGEIGLRS